MDRVKSYGFYALSIMLLNQCVIVLMSAAAFWSCFGLFFAAF